MPTPTTLMNWNAEKFASIFHPSNSPKNLGEVGDVSVTPIEKYSAAGSKSKRPKRRDSVRLGQLLSVSAREKWRCGS
jgi:hypothetical protein